MTFDVLLNRPSQRSVQLLNSDRSINFTASLEEPALAVDPTSGSRASIPPFVAYTASSTSLIAPLVFVNYGRVEDYELLKAMNVSLEEHVFLVRYGPIFRGNQAILAEQHGASGVLLYSDPANEGACWGPVYPEGRYQPPFAYQRGTLYMGAGDPSTPGYASLLGAPRLSISELCNASLTLGTPLPNIPVLPLSFDDAKPLLDSLSKNPIPQQWKEMNTNYPPPNGTFFIGPSSVLVNMSVQLNYTIEPIWNVIGKLYGQLADRVIVVGAHRDAWSPGAASSCSGTAVLLETARILTQMVADGWKPLRSIWFCSWDAEEYGVIGSTEFGEYLSATLQEEVIAYINLDTVVTGATHFLASGTPSLAEFLRNVSRDITCPGSAQSVYDLWLESSINSTGDSQLTVPILKFLASGSDFSVFQQHLGIPSLGFSFADVPFLPVYHSDYDSFYWTSHFGDPTFDYHAIVVQILGKILIRFSTLPLLPLEFTQYAFDLWQLVSTLQLTANSLGAQETDINFAPLFSAVATFNQSAYQVAQQVANMQASSNPSGDALLDLNDRLMTVERAFLQDNVNPRPWYKHVVFAPSSTNNYYCPGFATLTEAINNYDWSVAQQQIGLLAGVIFGVSGSLLGDMVPEKSSS